MPTIVSQLYKHTTSPIYSDCFNTVDEQLLARQCIRVDLIHSLSVGSRHAFKVCDFLSQQLTSAVSAGRVSSHAFACFVYWKNQRLFARHRGILVPPSPDNGFYTLLGENLKLPIPASPLVGTKGKRTEKGTVPTVSVGTSTTQSPPCDDYFNTCLFDVFQQLIASMPVVTHYHGLSAKATLAYLQTNRLLHGLVGSSTFPEADDLERYFHHCHATKDCRSPLVVLHSLLRLVGRQAVVRYELDGVPTASLIGVQNDRPNPCLHLGSVTFCNGHVAIVDDAWTPTELRPYSDNLVLMHSVAPVPSRVNSVQTEPDEETASSMTADLIAAVTAQFKGEAATTALQFLGPATSIFAAIYNLTVIAGAGQISWHAILVNVSAIVGAIVSIAVTVMKTINFTNLVNHLTSAFMSTIRNHLGMSEPMSNTEAGPMRASSLVFKLLAMVVCGSMFAAGLPGNFAKINGLLAASGNLASLGDGLYSVAASYLGFDIDGSQATAKLIEEYIEKCDYYLNIPGQQVYGDTLAEMRAWSEQAHKLMASIKSGRHSAGHGMLAKKIVTLDATIASTMRDINNRQDRPDPVAIYLWSTQGGLGKTTFSRYVAQYLAQAFGGFNDGVWTSNACGAHPPAYQSEDTVVFDEVGSNPSSTNDPLLVLNTVLSASSATMPAADIEHKGQILKPKLVVVCSNYAYQNLPRNPLQEPGRLAQRSRLMEFEFVDERFNSRADNVRSDQPHRKDDYSHIVFRQHLPNGTCNDLRVEELLSKISSRLVSNHRSFTKRVSSRPMNVPHFAAGQPAGERYNLDESLSAADATHTLLVSGYPELGKTRVFLGQIRELVTSLGYDMVNVASLDDMPDFSTVSKTTVFVFDDVVDFSSPTDQHLLLQANNNANTLCRFVILSNFGPSKNPVLQPVLWSRAHYRPFKCHVPGLIRRLGLDKPTPQGRTVVYTPGGATDLYTGSDYSISDLGTDWLRLDLGSQFPVMLDELPADLGFTAAEADVWLVCNDQASPTAIAARLIAQAKPRLRAALSQVNPLDCASRDTNAIVYQLFSRVIRTHGSVRGYVAIHGYVYYINGTSIYIGGANQDADIVVDDANQLVVRHRGAQAVVTQGWANAIWTEDFSAVPEAEYPLLFELMKHRQYADNVWEAFCARFPEPTESFMKRSTRIFTHAALAARNFLEKHRWAVALIAVLCLGYMVYRVWFKPTAVEPVKEDRYPCELCDSGRSYICPAVNEDLFHDLPFAKGKTKGLKKKFAKTMRIGGHTVSISDAEELPVGTQGLVHAVRHVNAATGFRHDNHEEILEHGGQSWNVGYSYAPNGSIQHFAYLIDDEPMANNEITGFRANQVHLRNPLNCNMLYGTMITDRIVRFGEHVMVDTPPNTLLELKSHPGFVIKPLYTVANSDTVYGIVQDQKGRYRSLPGIKDISNCLLSVCQLRSVGMVTCTNARLPDRQFSKHWNFQTMLTPPVQTECQYLEKNVAVLTVASMSSGGLAVGDCGSNLTALLNNKEYFVGQLSSRRVARSQFLFSVPTREEWNEFVVNCNTPIYEPMSEIEPVLNEYIPAQYLLPPQFQTTREAKLWRPVAFRLGRPSDEEVDYTAVGPGMETVASFAGNHTPVDTKETRRVMFPTPSGEPAFGEIFGVLKEPTITAQEIESDYTERIPRDAVGNIHAYNIRLANSNKNVAYNPDNEAPATTASRVERMKDANDLGQYWATRCGLPGIKPLSVDDAVWGCSYGGVRIDSMKRNTSNGALFQSIVPKARKKADLWTEERSVWTDRGPGSADFPQLIKDQWDAAKVGTEILYPSSLSLKSEMLETAKVWKKRIVHCVDPVTVINQRRLFMPIQKHFDALESASPFILDISPLVGYDALAKRLRRFPYLMDCDASSFDLSVPLELLECAAEFLCGFCRAGPILRNLLFTYCRMIANTPFLVDANLITKQGGVCSGIACTSFIDGVIMHCLVYFYWRSVHPSHNSVRMYRNNVDAIHCGDDTNVACSASCARSGFSPSGMCTYAKNQFNMTFTPAAKDAKSMGWLKIEELSFCSRTFSRIPGNTHLFSGRLKESAMSSALCYTKFTTDDEAMDQLRTMANEMCLYGQAKYEQYVKVCAKLRLDIGLGTFADTIRNLVNEIEAVTLPVDLEETQVNLVEFKFTDSSAITEIPSVLKFDLSMLEAERTEMEIAQSISITTLTRHLRVAFASSTSLDAFLATDAAKNFMAANFEHEFQVVVIAGASLQIPQQFSPTSWWQILDAAIEGTFVAWWNVVSAAPNPNPNTKAGVKLAARKAIASASLSILAGDLGPYQALLAAFYAGEPMGERPQPVFASNDDEEHAHRGNDGTPVKRLHSHACQHCNRRFAHSHAIKPWALSKTYGLHRCRRCLDGLDESMSERPAEVRTGQPPTTEPVSSSASATASSNMPVGVGEDLVPAASATDTSVSPAVVAGQAVAPLLITPGGGVDASIVSQTGYDKNVLELAGEKIFKEINYINVGTAQGTVVYSAEVNPWNERILNPFAKQVADLHERFDGNFIVHIEMFTAATIIGGLKAVYIPYVTRQVPRTQTYLDSLPAWCELSAGVSGEFSVVLPCTVGANAKTGIYRYDDNIDQFGTFVVYTCTDIRNTYDNANVAIQLKVCFSLAPESRYTIPTLVGGGPAGKVLDSPIDIGVNDDTAVLTIDGIHRDAIDWFEAFQDDPERNQYFGGDIRGTGYLDVVPYTDYEFPPKVSFVTGYWPSFEPITTVTGDSIIDFMTDRSPVPSLRCNGTVFTGDAAYTNWLTEIRSPGHIRYSNIQCDYGYIGNTCFTNIAGSWSGRCFGTDENTILEFSQATKLVSDAAGRALVNYRVSMSPDITVSLDPEGGSTDNVTYPVAYGPQNSRCLPIAKLGKIPVCIAGDKRGAIIPTSYLAMRLSDASGYLPSVSVGELGASIPMLTAHTATMLSVADDFSTGSGGVITDLSDPDGNFVAAVLRNRYGMFVNRAGLPTYATLADSLLDMTQTHQRVTTDWPQLRTSNPAAFISRIASSQIAGAVGRNYATTTLSQKEVEVYAHSRKNPRYMNRRGDQSMATAAAGVLLGTAGIKAGGDLLGKLFQPIDTIISGGQSRMGIRETGSEIRKTADKNYEIWGKTNPKLYEQSRGLATLGGDIAQRNAVKVTQVSGDLQNRNNIALAKQQNVNNITLAKQQNVNNLAYGKQQGDYAMRIASLGVNQRALGAGGTAPVGRSI